MITVLKYAAVKEIIPLRADDFKGFSEELLLVAVFS